MVHKGVRFLNIFEGDKRAQGATEYLLMLAAVLVVVAVAVSMLMGMGPELAVSSPASVQDDGDEIVVGTADMDISPNDAVISQMTLLSEGTTVETIDIDQAVDNMDLNYSTGDVADYTANDIDEIVIEDDEGNTTSMTPIKK